MAKETVGIIGGKGKMGQFFARFFEKHGFHVLISDVGTKHSNIDVAQNADIVLISVPMDRVEQVIQEVGGHVKKDSLLMDVNSIKAPVVKKMLECSVSEVLGCHPMFAPVNHLEGQVIIFCEGRGKRWPAKLRELFEKNGAEVRVLDAEKHDELMTVIQGLMHFSDITMTKTLSDTGIPVEKFFAFRSPSYRLKLDLMGRTLHQNPNLYGNIQIQNPKTDAILHSYLRNATELQQIVKRKSLGQFADYWNIARQYLGDFSAVCQKESDDIIDFLSASAQVSVSSEPDEQSGSLGILGPKNTFSYLAAQKFFPDEEDMVLCRSIPETFEAFSNQKVPSILVPIENKLHGSVRETLDSLFSCDSQIQAVFRLPIRFVLATLPGTERAKIERISSHPQPLAQCSEFLQRSFPNAQCIPVSSTAVAIEEMVRSANPHSAVICAPEAAHNSGLTIVEQNIIEGQENETRFAFLSRDTFHHKGIAHAHQSSVVFYFDHDSPGSLASVLQDFSNANINLTKIESRPVGHVFGDYLFFLDFEGTIYNDTVQEVLERVEHKVAQLKVLGSYPVI